MSAVIADMRELARDLLDAERRLEAAHTFYDIALARYLRAKRAADVESERKAVRQ
ncbi:MAG TPA: hypothetical protein VMG11_09315 [Steroidobacteraceae bacterium]|nr:hypothetical protein [Steroidobacteraceae bacterium]